MSSVDLHRQAERLFDEGMIAESYDDNTVAAMCFRKAAELEEAAAATIPAERPRTHAILLRSAEAARAKAAQLAQND